MIIRKSDANDATDLTLLFDEARATIAMLGIDQWQDGYPQRSVIEGDIRLGRSYCVCDDGICGTFVLLDDGEPTYDRIFDGEWLTGDSRSYIAIHRVAVAKSRRGSGISTLIIDYAASVAHECGRRSLRIDTHRGNVVMRRMLERHGFVHCGTILLPGGAERVVYEKILEMN